MVFETETNFKILKSTDLALFEKTLLVRTKVQSTAFLGPFFDFELGFIVKFESIAKPERKTQNDHLERAIWALSWGLQWFPKRKRAPNSDGLSGARCLKMMVSTKRFVRVPAKARQRPGGGLEHIVLKWWFEQNGSHRRNSQTFNKTISLTNVKNGESVLLKTSASLTKRVWCLWNSVIFNKTVRT